MKLLKERQNLAEEGNLAKKRGREVVERGADRYKAEEKGGGGVKEVVYSCSANMAKESRSSRLLVHVSVLGFRTDAALVCVCELLKMNESVCESQ